MLWSSPAAATPLSQDAVDGLNITVISLKQDKEVQLIEDERCGVYIHQCPSTLSSVQVCIWRGVIINECSRKCICITVTRTMTISHNEIITAFPSSHLFYINYGSYKIYY